LRAPLRAINGFSRILADLLVLDGADDARRYLGVIRDNAQQMGRLIDDLLSFSRLSRQALKKSPLSPSELIEQVLATLSSEHEERQIEMNIGDLPVCLGDASLLKQVWMNLLSNALKFTRDCKPARIEIGFEQQPGEIIYFVKDNGTGFDMRYVDKLFGVFQRLHRPEDYEGTGVGLAIVQRIIRRHGGRVWAESELGKGAAFYFSLPIE
jgi:signal transduction histidine kinase